MGRPTKANTEKTSAEKPVRIKIDSDYLIPVKSNVGGVLYYKSKKTGYEEVWDETGIVIEMEYGELVSMRNSQKKFFINNWILRTLTITPLMRFIKLLTWISIILQMDCMIILMTFLVSQLRRLRKLFLLSQSL